jgi:hypothetical protein
MYCHRRYHTFISGSFERLRLNARTVRPSSPGNSSAPVH